MSERKFGSAQAAMHALAASAVVLMLTFSALPISAAESSNEVRAEADIKDMHSKLAITTAQEERWARIAAVMRDNAKRLDTLTSARITNATNAVEQINSYGVSAYERADGVKRFAPVFAALYATMPEAQKAKADELFRDGNYAIRL